MRVCAPPKGVEYPMMNEASPDSTSGPSLLRRPLGRTGWQISELALGGVKWDTQCSEAEAVRLIRRAIELGVNAVDTAHAYGGGQSEMRLGLALEGLRDRVFVSTKVSDHTYDGARRQMDLSLRRLRMERVDLMFIHDLGDADDLARVRGRAGALRALEEYRDAGRIRFIGASSHWHRSSLLRLMEEYPLDVVLFPAGLFNQAYGYDYLNDVLPLARRRGIGTLGMKIFGAGRVKHAASIEPYLRYGRNTGVDAMVIGCDSIAQLEPIVSILRRRPGPLTLDEERALYPECLRITQAWDRGEFNWVSHYTGRRSS